MRDAIKEIIVRNVDESHKGYEKAIDEILLLFSDCRFNKCKYYKKYKMKQKTNQIKNRKYGHTKNVIWDQETRIE